MNDSVFSSGRIQKTVAALKQEAFQFGVPLPNILVVLYYLDFPAASL